MTFGKLAEYFEKLEETSSRLSLIEILSQLFKEVESDEIAKVSYLIQGRVGPFYEPLEIGMAEKSVAGAIARAYGLEREEVLKEYGKLGDLGKVAQKMSSLRKRGSRSPIRSGMTVSDVFKILRTIAQTSGDGTVEKKLTFLSDLLKEVDAISAKHLVRIPLGTSRLGIGDPTVLDGFATAKLGDKSQRKLLEGAYNKVSDLGIIGETLWKSGLKGVKKLDVSVGRPLRSQLAERLPNPEKVIEKFEGKAHCQQKFDGFRVQLHLDRSKPKGQQVRLFSRNLEETTPMFPELLEGALSEVKGKTAILDSEALAYNPESEEFLPFQETTKRRRKYDIEDFAKKLPLKAFVFDIMYLDGKSLVDLPLEERMKVLAKALPEAQISASHKGSVKISDQILIAQLGEFTSDPKVVTKMFDDALTKGLEGLIIKRPDSKYEAGARNFNWVKLKRHSSGELKDTIDTVILGYIYGRGKRASFGAGALLVGVYDKEKDEFVTVSKIGTGLTDEEWREIHKRADKIKVSHKPARVNSLLEPSVWIEPKIVIEVLADEITKSPNHTAGRDENGIGLALRFPRLVKFRESDKKAEDATTVKELKEMYQQQYQKG